MAKRRTRATVGSGLAAEDVFDLPPLRRGEAVAFATPRGTAGQVPGAGDVTNLVQPERFRPPSAATAPPGLARLPQSQLTKLGAVGASQQTAENKRNRERAASAQDRLRRQKADLAGGTIEAKIRRERAKGEPARKAAEQEAAAGVAKEERESKERIANVPVDVEQERTKRAAAETKAKSGDLATRIEGEQELANIKIKGDLAQAKAEGKTFEQQIDIIGEQSKARIAEADAKGNVEQRNAAVKAELGAYGDAMAEAVAAGNTTAAITIAEKMRTRANEFAGKTEATPAPEGTAGGAAAGQILISPTSIAMAQTPA